MSKEYEQKLLDDWSDIFRQGLLTFWVFVVINDKPLSVSETQSQVDKVTCGSYSAAEQTLYRLLRKQYDLETVDFTEIASRSGPKKKLYTLSPLGKILLKKFMGQNISLFYHKNVTKLIEGTEK